MSGTTRRRFFRRSLQVAIGGTLLICAAWLLAAPAIGRYLGDELIARAEADWRVQAQLEDAHLGRDGELLLQGLSLKDMAGQELLELGQLRITPDFSALLSGQVSADVDLSQLLVVLRVGADGAMNWAQIKRESQAGDDREAGDSQRDAEGGADLSAYLFSVRWSEVTVRIAEGDAAAEDWAGLGGELEWDGSTGLGHMSLEGAMVERAAGAGKLRIEAQVAASDGIFNDESQIVTELDLERLALAPLGFLFGADAQPSGGELNATYRMERSGAAQWRLEGEGHAEGVQMELEGSSLLLPSASLIASEGSGRPHLEFLLGEALSLQSSGLPLRNDSMRWQFDADLALLSALKPDLLGGNAEGELSGSGNLRALEFGAWNTTLDLSAASIRWISGESAPIVQKAVTVAGSLVMDANHVVEFEELELTTDSLRAKANGALSSPKIEFEARLEQLAQDFDFESSGLGGHLLAQLNLNSIDKAWELLGNVSVEDFQVQVDSQTRLYDPKLSVEMDALVDGGKVDLRRAVLDGELLRGELRGQFEQLADSKQWLMPNLEGEFDYIPDSLARQLSELIPVEWGGSEATGIALQLSTSEPADSIVSILDHCSGKGVLGLGRLVVLGLEVQGDLDWKLEQGNFQCSTVVDTGGGRVRFDLATPLGLAERGPRAKNEAGSIELGDSESPVPGASANFSIEDVTVGQAIAPLLARVHPLFAAYNPGDDEEFQASVQSEFQVELPVPLIQWFSEGQQLDQIGMRGLLQASNVLLGEDGPLAQLIAEVAGDDHGALRLRPLEFQLEGGQLRYLRPWTWTIDEVETSFVGSVGLDGEVRLDWTMPITQSLADRRNLPDFLVGRVFEVPIRGSMKSPRVGIVDAIAALVKSSFGSGLQESLQGIAPAGGKGAAELLQEADKLWDAGKTSEAAVLYRKLRSEFKLSATYLLNKSRIKSRSRTE